MALMHSLQRTFASTLLGSVSLAAAIAACSTTAPAPNAPAADAASPPSAASVASKGAALTAKDVDAKIRAAWQAANVTPAAPIDDARWLRRVYLDVIGVIPTAANVTAFLADAAPDKRAKAVRALLADPRYADHWAAYWDRVLLGKDVRQQLVDRDAFRSFLRDELTKNAPYDKFVTDLLTASGQNREDVVLKMAKMADDAAKPGMAAAEMKEEAADAKAQPLNGAVNYFVRFFDQPQDLAGVTSKVFLGVQIQCAQCHDHKTEKWKQADFQKFAACFAETRIQPIDPAKVASRRRVEVDDSGRIGFFKKRKEPELKAIAEAKPAALDGTDFSSADNRRQALAKWMTAKDNPWFAQAFVNRMWSHFLGRGFVDPITDFRPSNPPSAPDALKALADDFVAQGYDVKRLIELITATEAYGLAPARGEAPKAEAEKLWSSFHVEPLGPDELLDSIVVATNLEGKLDRQVLGKSVEDVRAQLDKQFNFLFDVDEESDAPDFTGTIPQALFLLNGGPTNNQTRAAPGSTLGDVLAMGDDDAAKVKALYLHALSREPTPDEIAAAVDFVNAPRDVVNPNGEAKVDEPKPKKNGKKNAKDEAQAKHKRGRIQARRQAYEDLFWALLNSSEFAFNH